MSTKAASLKKTGHHHLANLQTEATHRLAQLKMTVWDRLGRLETYVASFVKGQVRQLALCLCQVRQSFHPR